MANFFNLTLDTIGPTGNPINMFEDAIVGEIVGFNLTANDILGNTTYAYIMNEKGYHRPVDIIVDGLTINGTINTWDLATGTIILYVILKDNVFNQGDIISKEIHLIKEYAYARPLGAVSMETEIVNKTHIVDMNNKSWIVDTKNKVLSNKITVISKEV